MDKYNLEELIENPKQKQKGRSKRKMQNIAYKEN
jgi:hypothetical protein